MPNVRGSSGLGSKSRGFCLCWTFTLAIYDSAVPRTEHSTSSILRRPVRCKAEFSYLRKVNPPQIKPVQHTRSDTIDWIFHGFSMFPQMGNYSLRWNSGLNIADVTYQWWDEVNAGHVVHIVHLHLTVDSFISTWFNTWLENVCIVEMLHCLSTQVDAQMFQLTWLQHEDKAWCNDSWSILPAK